MGSSTAVTVTIAYAPAELIHPCKVTKELAVPCLDGRKCSQGAEGGRGWKGIFVMYP